MNKFSSDWNESHRNRKSTWYVPGDWALPDWWTAAKAERGVTFTREEYDTYFKNWNCSVTKAPPAISHFAYMEAVYRSVGLPPDGMG